MSDGRWILVAVAACAIALSAPRAHARDVKRCGITIGAGKTGTLVKDVECGHRCSGDSTVRCKDGRCPVDGTQSCVPEIILLERNATLDLNGFTLRGAPGQTTVECAPSPQGPVGPAADLRLPALEADIAALGPKAGLEDQRKPDSGDDDAARAGKDADHRG